MKRLMTFAALTITAFTAHAGWVQTDNVAHVESPVQVGAFIGIVFPGGDCDTAYLSMIGNESVSSMMIVVDDTIIGPGYPVQIEDVLYWELKPSALSALKFGNDALFITDQGSLFTSLSGTSKAINAAWRYCERQLNRL